MLPPNLKMLAGARSGDNSSSSDGVMVMVAVVATIAAVRVVCIIIIEAQDPGAYDSRQMN